ncbi:SMP-30/gluconolactonase/LRE family protein [Actinokineospora sp. HUAS TT18]|uniref:SMP-30/gluconolactonase/LRE family protein n=1 Tax=Actinokineospora sp. HUAS TT18 TaxID=3447451 RepID=UPI003F51E2BA
MGMIERLAQPDLLVHALADVGEGPVWDERHGTLCWVDILAGLLHETDLATGAHTTAELGTSVGAAAPRASADGFAVAVADGFGYWVDGRLTIADPVLPEPYRRMNDAKCDSRGRMWAGGTHLDFVPGAGTLHRWDGGGPSTVHADGLALPNGLGWSPDDTTMYLIDSVAQRLMRAPFDPDDGHVGAFTELATVDPGLPDGLAVDADGFLWVAVWGGGEVRRFSPAGDLVAVVPMPVSQPSSCAFTPDGTLVITSARHGLTEDELAGEPLAGSVFALATTTRGVPVHAFAG